MCNEGLLSVKVIARKNDEFRKSGANVVMTPGVMYLADVLGLLRSVFDYDSFSIDSDPYGEHDFGSLSWKGETVLWKIDYYDSSMWMWCDPLSADCHRVMTVMLASEY